MHGVDPRLEPKRGQLRDVAVAIDRNHVHPIAFKSRGDSFVIGNQHFLKNPRREQWPCPVTHILPDQGVFGADTGFENRGDR